METEPTQRSPFSLVEVTPYKNQGQRLAEARKQSKNGQPQGTDSTQVFDQSPLADAPVTEAAANDPDALFGAVDNPPNLAVLEEQPWHRLVIYLKAQGLSNREIAQKTSKSEPWISQVTRQPWFRLRLVQELREAGVDAIQQTLRANALDSVFTLVDLRDDLTAPKAVRKAAADSLLDRYLGKATQKVEHEEKRAPTTEELHSLNQEIDNIEKTLKNENS